MIIEYFRISFALLMNHVMLFVTQVRKIEKRDAVLTGAQQIDRLLRPGAKYGNLNPFDVRSVDPCKS